MLALGVLGDATSAASTPPISLNQERKTMSQQQPPIITIKMVPAGVELVLQALNKLPREMSDGLFNEIAGQYGYQLQELQKAQQAEQGAAPVVAENAANTDEVQA